VKCQKFGYEVVRDVQLSEFCKGRIAVTAKELEEEVKEAYEEEECGC
jgi:hypothetical protein